MQNPIASNSGRAATSAEWLTTLQAARRMGYRTDKPIMRAIRAGELRAYHAASGRGLRVRLADLETWVETFLVYQPAAETASAVPERRKRRQTAALTYATSHSKAAA